MNSHRESGIPIVSCVVKNWKNIERFSKRRIRLIVHWWKICWDMLGKVWDMLGKYLIWWKLSAYYRCCNIKCRSIRSRLLELTVSEYCFGAVRRCWRYQRCRHRNSGSSDHNGVVSVGIKIKKRLSRKKISDICIFNICPILDSIVSDNLVVMFAFMPDKSRTNSDNYLYISYLREQIRN